MKSREVEPLASWLVLVLIFAGLAWLGATFRPGPPPAPTPSDLEREMLDDLILTAPAWMP